MARVLVGSGRATADRTYYVTHIHVWVHVCMPAHADTKVSTWHTYDFECTRTSTHSMSVVVLLNQGDISYGSYRYMFFLKNTWIEYIAVFSSWNLTLLRTQRTDSRSLAAYICIIRLVCDSLLSSATCRWAARSSGNAAAGGNACRWTSCFCGDKAANARNNSDTRDKTRHKNGRQWRDMATAFAVIECNSMYGVDQKDYQKVARGINHRGLEGRRLPAKKCNCHGQKEDTVPANDANPVNQSNMIESKNVTLDLHTM